MKNKTKRTVAALLFSGAMVLTTGCKQKISSDTVVIHAANLGYGLSWLHKLTDDYSKKTGVKFKIQEAIGQDGVVSIMSEIQSLTGRSDILITRPRTKYFSTIYEGQIQAANGQTYPCAFEDLTDICTTPYDGETGNNTIVKKLNKSYLDYITVNEKQYALPWANGFMSFARNVDKWNELGLTDNDIPYTTNQMFECFNKITSKGTKALIYSRSDEYYSSIPNVWFGQYEGKVAQDLYKEGLSPSGELNGNIFTYDGQVESLKVLETIADNEAGRAPKEGQYNYGTNNWTHESSKSASFTQMQNYFYGGACVFCLNGTWLEIEMTKSTNAVKGRNVDFIRIPVISSITNRMNMGDSSSPSYIADDAQRDAKLAEVVKYVDEHATVGDNATKPSGVTDDDVEIVREARVYNSVQGTDYDHVMLVPSWSGNKEAAKGFLKYIYSDEGLQTFYNTMEGHHLPAVKSTGAYDVPFTLTPFRQSANALLEEGHFSGFDYIAEKNKIFCIANILTNFSNNIPGGNFFNAMRDSNLSAEEIIDKNDNYIVNKWDNIRGQIGA